MASFYVKRQRGPWVDCPVPRVGWAGPIRSYAQAVREVEAWQEAGWSAALIESTPEVRREVNAWQREADRRLGRVR